VGAFWLGCEEPPRHRVAVPAASHPTGGCHPVSCTRVRRRSNSLGSGCRARARRCRKPRCPKKPAAGRHDARPFPCAVFLVGGDSLAARPATGRACSRASASRGSDTHAVPGDDLAVPAGAGRGSSSRSTQAVTPLDSIRTGSDHRQGYSAQVET
jgi:hypothetical protein